MSAFQRGPLIPFMPLLLKDMTFAHEGNKTSIDGLVNFEKMHMMAQTLRTIRFCRSRHLGKLAIYSYSNNLFKNTNKMYTLKKLSRETR